MRSVLGWAGVALVALAVGAMVPAAASAPAGAQVRFVRWEIVAKVTDGHQNLTRLASLSPPNFTGSGTSTSSWTARFRVRVKIDGSSINFTPASAYKVSGNVSGEYHGSYPKNSGGSVTYSCPFGPIAPRQVQTQYRLRGYGRTNTQMVLTWYPLHEPAVLPPVTCTGGPVDSGVPSRFSSGLFTGFESDCLTTHPGPPGRKLTGTRAFTYTKHFAWSATSSHGHDKYCNGFGGPIGGNASGTLKFTFRRI